jgi:hypothetical protein
MILDLESDPKLLNNIVMLGALKSLDTLCRPG